MVRPKPERTPVGLTCMYCHQVVGTTTEIRDVAAHDAMFREHEQICPVLQEVP